MRRQLGLLAALNLELAKLEGKQKATALGLAAGLAAGGRRSCILRNWLCLRGGGCGAGRSPLSLRCRCSSSRESSCSRRGSNPRLRGDALCAQGFASPTVPGNGRSGVDAQDAAGKWLSAALARSGRRWPSSEGALDETREELRARVGLRFISGPGRRPCRSPVVTHCSRGREDWDQDDVRNLSS